MIEREPAPHEPPGIRPFAATIPPGALRAARALMGLTQTQAAGAIRISRASLAACETGSVDTTLKTIAALREFYQGRGIKFLGRTDWAQNVVHGSGAYWHYQAAVLRRLPLPKERNFSAARALLGLERREAADGAGLTSRQVGNLENGGSFTKKSHDCLRDFYVGRGVEFLSVLACHRFVGLGVRRASDEVSPPQSLWVNRGDHLFTRIPTVWKRNQYNWS
ncbi:helix-turn-helix transcriptional regulator [Rhizobium cauense]|nr:helix-turn-helix transcriptional regulator [Rhizobium cauense]MBW9113858.1 helix-turn-helix transcriptional regulator [Rhizobium cauense]